MFTKKYMSYCKYKKQRRRYSDDNGKTWVYTDSYQKGELIQCGLETCFEKDPDSPVDYNSAILSGKWTDDSTSWYWQIHKPDGGIIWIEDYTNPDTKEFSIELNDATTFENLFWEDLKAEQVLEKIYTVPFFGRGIISMEDMFQGCLNLNEIKNIEYWDVSSVETFHGFLSMSYYNNYDGGGKLTNLDLSKWNTKSAVDISYMFERCTSLESINLSGWDVSKVKQMIYMFRGCSKLERLDLSGWNVSSVEETSAMFNGCSSLQSIDLSGWDVSKVKQMNSMFENCTSLESINLSGWNPSIQTDASFNSQYMFSNCSSLQSIDLSGWTKRISNGDYMFRGCSKLERLDLSGWNFQPSSKNKMFDGCSKLNYIKCPKLFQDWCWYFQNVINLPDRMRKGYSGTWEIVD